jgi:hypothetical protein
VYFAPRAAAYKNELKHLMFSNIRLLEVGSEQTVGGGSIVASVNSDDGWANFDRDNGNANDNAGVGLSARQNTTKTQAHKIAWVFYFSDFSQPPSIRPISSVLAFI